jgi:aspartyl-tRNA(Asn)/glutamyl-tRNA(Gln) amidotransferase subunit C
MPARLTKSDVRYIAELAHLDLTSDEEDLFTRQLADILAYAEQIGAVDTTGVPATSHVLARGAGRLDQVRPSLPRSEALANAPDPAREAGLFRVPRVIG